MAALWPGDFASPWALLVSILLSLLALAFGAVVSRRQIAWWRATRDQYENARNVPVSEAVSTADKGEALAESVRRVYRRMGYDIPPHRKSREKGIDVIAQLFGRYGIQCKNLKIPAGVDAVQEAFAGSPYWDCCRHCAIVVSPNGFTGDAEELARKIGVRLIDGKAYQDMIDRFKPRGVAWPVGAPRAVQLTMLGASLLVVGLCGAATLSGGQRPANEPDTYLYATLIGVLLSLGVAWLRSREGQTRKIPVLDLVPARDLAY